MKYEGADPGEIRIIRICPEELESQLWGCHPPSR